MLNNMDKNIWDTIIVGAGPAGCSAAIVLARSKRRVLIIDEGKQRNLSSQGMHNFLTRDGILPKEYLSLAHEELVHYQIDIINSGVVSAKKEDSHGFLVADKEGNQYLGRRILLATGVTDKIPEIPGMRELWGRGIYHCPYCDGYECGNKVIGLYAHDINGYGMALALRELSDKIILFTDGARYLRALQREHLAARGITIISRRIKELARKDNALTGIVLKDGETVACDSLFVDNGHHVNDELLKQLGCNCTKKGAAITNKQQQTNIAGVYVAGDASFDMHFVVVAAAEGAKAAVAINNDLLKTDNAI